MESREERGYSETGSRGTWRDHEKTVPGDIGDIELVGCSREMKNSKMKE